MMHSEPKNLEDLSQDAENARAHNPRNIGMIRDSLHSVGAARSIVIDENNVILAGNGVFEAAAEAGIHRVQVVDADGETIIAVRRRGLSPEQKKKLAYYDNRTAELADWSVEQVLADLEAGLDLSDLWSDEELNALLESLPAGPTESLDAGARVDQVAELREKWGTETGQVWGLGRHRLVVGDCTDPAVVEAVMQGEKAALGVTSPPYAIGKEYERDTTFDEHLALLRRWARVALVVIKPGGFLFVNFSEVAPQSHANSLTGSDRQCLYLISKDYWHIFHTECGMDLYAMRVWYKPFHRLQQPFWTYRTSIPHHQEWEHLWTWRLPGGRGDRCFDWDVSARAVWDTREEGAAAGQHVASFPVGIPERALRAHSAVNDIVWEPFAGSGTTIIACENLKRVCRACEIEPGYAAVALQRFEDTFGVEPKLM